MRMSSPRPGFSAAAALTLAALALVQAGAVCLLTSHIGWAGQTGMAHGGLARSGHDR
jgi:hypothetical protein